MSLGTTPRAVLWGTLARHHAFRAWSAAADCSGQPERIEVLRQGDKSATYRLVGVGPGSTPVVAKRLRAPKAAIERTAYEHILPHLSVTAPRYYGFRADGAEYIWVFLEDVGTERYSETNPAHLALAARWVGSLHTGVTRIGAARALPDGGPARYLEHLRTGRQAIRAGAANPGLAARDVTTLERLVADLDALERDWTVIERACSGVPATLVHGDFRPRNAYLRSNGTQLHIFPIDWEHAGWGVPAADLTRIDLATYWTTVHESWPDVQLEDVQRLGHVGQIFRRLAAIRWMSPQLTYDTPEWLSGALANLQAFHTQLTDALRGLRGPHRRPTRGTAARGGTAYA